MLPIAILLLVALFGTAAAQTSNYTTCIQQGYNLTALTGADILYTGNGYNWAIRPCGVVTTAGYCTDFPGEFCQGGTTISATNVSTATSAIGAGLGATWAQVQYNGQYGVAQFLQDGTTCSNLGYDREGTIEFICNSTATTPFVSSINETTTCHYQAIVQTSVVCSAAAAGFSTTPGTSIISSTCGAGIYDLTTLNSADITATSLQGYNWNIRLCGTVSSSASCNTTTNPTVSICQSGNILATYAPASNPVIYQYLAPGVMSQIIQDGGACANQNRVTNVTLFCNSSATTPLLTSVVEHPTCHYTLNVQTSQVCGAAFAGSVQPTASSSTGVARASSSSSSAAVTVSSSTGAAAVTVSSSAGAVVQTSNYTTCIQQGYNLTALTGSDLLYTGNGYNWAIRPCGVVTTAGYCTDFPGEFCQGGTTVSAVNTSTATASVLSGAIWAQVQYNGQYGVAQFLQDGTSCGAFDREGTIEFICNATATTPFLSSVVELTTCHYQAIIQTSVVCSTAAAGFSTTPGTAIASTTCGAGIYDLTTLNSADITATNLQSYNWSIRVCGPVASPSPCNLTANPTTSICQVGETTNILATYAPASYPVVYQYLAPGVMSQIIQDGAGCVNQNRLTNVTLFCNSSATTPLLTSVVESPTCHYTFNVQTNQVCGAAFSGGSVQPGASSSTTVLASSSSTGAASTGAASTSTGSVVVRSSSSSSASNPSTPTSTTGASQSGSATSSPVTVASSSTGTVASSSTGTVVPPTIVNSASAAFPALASVLVLIVSIAVLFA